MTPERARRPAPRALMAGGLALACLVAGCGEGQDSEVRTRSFRRVLHEVALEDGLWRTLDHGEGRDPAAGVLTPSMQGGAAGEDAPALILPPPSRVAFTVPAGEGDLVLSGRTGVDVSAPRALGEEIPGVEVELSVEVDGQTVWSNTHIIRQEGHKDRDGLLWQDLPEIALQPGQEVVLASRVKRPRGLESPPRLELGFGDLELVQTGQRRVAEATPERPNVLLIVMDTLRQDRLSCYGYELETTPALDALAARGILYEDAYAASSWTWPSTASILTGLVPEAHGVRSPERCHLNQGLETLPELLAERRLATGAITCNPLIVPNKNFDQGFDYFDSSHRFRRTELVMDATLDWLRLHAETRFFLYVQLVDTHESYHPSPEATARAGGARPADYPRAGMNAYHQRLLASEALDEAGRPRLAEVVPPAHLEWMGHAYDAAVITADEFVGRVLDELDDLDLTRRTVVAFTSDHGEELGEHGLLTHGNSLFPEVTRVPLILAGPGLPRGVRVATPVSNRHLAPSLAALAGATFEGLDDALDLLTPADLGPAPVYFSTDRAFWNGERNVQLHGLREGSWELHWAPRGRPLGASSTPPHGDARLYDLEHDPDLQHDVAAQHPERVSLLRTQLEAHLAAATAPTTTSLGAGKRSRESLLDIGYIGAEEAED